MKYRSMSLDDYDDVISIWRESKGIWLRDSDSRENIKQYLNDYSRLCFVAEHDRKLVGTIMSSHDGLSGQIKHLFVVRSWRKFGIGSQLLKLKFICS